MNEIVYAWPISMVTCQKGPTRHAYAWQIEPFWRDTFDLHIGAETQWATLLERQL